MELNDFLNAFTEANKALLGDALAGVYLHGSAALGGYSPLCSDLDFIIAIKGELTAEVKRRYMDEIVRLDSNAPGHGLELSLVSVEHCRKPEHPIPYELHFSRAHLEWYRTAPDDYVARMKGRDPDLAAHFTVLRAAGVALYGPPAPQMFGPVSRRDYFDSVWSDIGSAVDEIGENRQYAALNLARTLCYLATGRVASKREGGMWALRRVPARFAPLIQAALDERAGIATAVAPELEREYALYMLAQIEKIARAEGIMPHQNISADGGNTMDVYENLKQLGITLPEPPPKGGLYTPCVISGNMAYISGCGCAIGDEKPAGKLGAEYDLEAGQRFARNCALNILAVLQRDVGDLNRVAKAVKMLAFVASADDFYMQPQVANGASQLLCDVFGAENGIPARSAIGVNVLPGNLPVEVECVFELKTSL